MFDCCESLIRSIEQKEFKFYPEYRGICLYFFDEENDTYGQHFIKFCPYCGTKMPNDLYASDAYCDALEEAVGKEYCDITEDEIPEEFKSDVWWKKRGL